jgi:hypothetical protein
MDHYDTSLVEDSILIFPYVFLRRTYPRNPYLHPKTTAVSQHHILYTKLNSLTTF